ncbi:MAG: hypothetical protein AB1345_02000 [Chloroflexota bacterium]
MNLDIHTFIVTAIILALVGMVLSLIGSISALRSAPKIPFFRLRRERQVRGWRLLLNTLFLGLLAFVLNRYAEPTIYQYFKPTPTLLPPPTTTLTPTITLSPTITPTPSITPTLEHTYTPTPTPTPHLPLAIEIQFTSIITPNPNSVFSPIQFSQSLDSSLQPLNPQQVFQNPIQHIYATYTYDGMIEGVQWTILWYRNGELIHYQTMPWDGGTGGYGYSDWNPPANEWIPGEYEVQIFVGTEWMVVGSFIVEGESPTITPTPTWTLTPMPSITPTPTYTLIPSITPLPTSTRWNTATAITPSPTNTRAPTATQITPSPTNTRMPTITTTP